MLGSGDMLYLAPGTSSLTRAQGTYVSDEEINAVIDFFKDAEPEYSKELQQLTSSAAGGAAAGGGDSGPRITMISTTPQLMWSCEKVAEVFSLLQRALGIGYGRAADDRLHAEDGVSENTTELRPAKFSTPPNSGNKSRPLGNRRLLIQ